MSGETFVNRSGGDAITAGSGTVGDADEELSLTTM
jgi:hypothetical protein